MRCVDKGFNSSEDASYILQTPQLIILNELDTADCHNKV